MIDLTARSGRHRGPCSDRVCSHGAVPKWSIVVPAKRLAVAKTRLRPLTDALGGPAHDELVLALLADTVAAAVGCPSVAEVIVVTDDAAAADAVRPLGARTLPDVP